MAHEHAFLYFVLIGVALFFPPLSDSVAARAVTGYVIVFVYIMAPLENLLIHIPLLNLAKMSSERIEQVTSAMAGPEVPAKHAFVGELAVPVSLVGVTHRYYREREDDVFRLGPVNLSM